MNNFRISYAIGLFISGLALAGCSSPLDRPYNSTAYLEDLNFFKENDADPEDLICLKLFVDAANGDTLKLSGRTYEELAELGLVIRDSMIQECQGQYESLKEEIDIAVKIRPIDRMLELDPDNSFASKEFPALNEIRQKEIADLKDSYQDTDEIDLRTGMAERILELNPMDTAFNRNLVGLYAKTRKYNEAKALLQNMEEKEILNDEERLNLTERVLIQQNVNSLIKISDKALNEKNYRDLGPNASIWDQANARSSGWKKNTAKVQGYATNVSQTVSAEVNVNVKFTVAITSRILFVSSTKNHTYNRVSKLILGPGEAKTFSAEIEMEELSGYSSFGSNSRIIDVSVYPSLISPKF